MHKEGLSDITPEELQTFIWGDGIKPKPHDA
jgi:hypothetical protein